MMINILSIRCSLAFAPYLSESAAQFLGGEAVTSRVVRQGGRGLILRSDGDLLLRHEHREVCLGREEALHYAATVSFRSDFYDILRMQDEVVLANAGCELLLSHPQSEMLLEAETVAALARAFAGDSAANDDGTLSGIPEWLRVSTGGARLLLSDQRTGRWVLLSDDHVRELERRLGSLRRSDATAARPAPPVIPLKGLSVHLQSAAKLAEALKELADTGRVTPFQEITPVYTLKASASTEGIELSDSDIRVALTAREARKWADIIRSELDRRNVKNVERGGIRTVFADDQDGRWILQWGDEVFVPNEARERLPGSSERLNGELTAKQIGAFLLLLSPGTGACVALTDSESAHIFR